MNRRQFLGGGLLGLASSSSLALTSPVSHTPGKSLLNRWVKVRASLLRTHPLRSRYGGDGDLGVWVDFDQLTGNFDISSQYDPIYSWPMANLMLGRDDPIPDDWRYKNNRFSDPLPPESLEWSEWMGYVQVLDSTGFKYQFPRYVKMTICRDIAQGIDEQRPHDRRDEFPELWMDVDLMTGEMLRCAVDDPIFDSEFARYPVFE